MPTSAEAIQVLIFLAPGYLAYRIYKIDYAWGAVPVISIAYGSLAFSAIGYLLAAVTLSLVVPATHTTIMNPLLAFLFSVVAGVIWRIAGHPLFHRALRLLHITNEDNQGDVWHKIFNDPKIYVRQIRVYLKSGDAFACDDTCLFSSTEREKHGIYSYYSHEDRQIGFIPTHRRPKGTTSWEELKAVDVQDWGVRFVYFNPGEVEYLEVRLADSKSLGQSPSPEAVCPTT